MDNERVDEVIGRNNETPGLENRQESYLEELMQAIEQHLTGRFVGCLPSVSLR